MTQRRRTALGREIRRTLRGEPIPYWERWRDSEWGKRLARATRYTAHDTAERPVRLRELHESRGRRLVALVLMLAEHARPHGTTVQSCGRNVCQLWLARRLRCSVRTVQRDLDALEAAGVLERWQPPAIGLPPYMRSSRLIEWRGRLCTWAYNIYRWRTELPSEIKALLLRYRQGPDLPQAARLPEVSAPAPEIASAEPVNEAARELMARFGAALGIGPPPKPA